MSVLLWIYITLIYSMICRCDGLRCLECSSIPHPTLCSTVTECPDTSSMCFTQKQYYAYGGFVLYSLGCMSQEKCNQTSYLHSRRTITKSMWSDVIIKRSDDIVSKRSDDVTICNDCCSDKDFCNIEGCGIKAANDGSRDLYCFDCDVASEAYGCRTVKRCDMGYVCSVQHSNFPEFYTANCVPESDCVHSAFNSASLIGRRDVESSNHIPYCCKTDFCNDMLNPNKTTSRVTNPWSVWNDWSACSVTCGTGLQHRTRHCVDGANCTGQSVEHGHCGTDRHCGQVDAVGHWSAWSNWSKCSVTCRSGRHFRSRQCLGGVNCPGVSRKYHFCHMGPCPNVSSSQGIQCFECVDVPDPAACPTVTQCAPASTCFTKKYITSAGYILYSSGCISQSRCNELQSAVANDDPNMDKRAGDVTLCEDCCSDRDFCNIEGCGVRAPNMTERGPYCFSCDHLTAYSRCRNVQQCQLGNVCKMHHTAVDGAYITGCVKKSGCSTDHRRGKPPRCCDSDFCNDLVDHKAANLPTESIDSWLPWSDWSACSATCEAGYQERKRQCALSANCSGNSLERSYCNMGLCQNSTAARCFECTDVPDPAACPTVTECSPPAVCYIRQYLTTAGSILYASGCMSKEMCNAIDSRLTSQRHKRDSLGSGKDVTTCEECCRTGDFCNNIGCGGKAVNVSDRGPYCFSCAVQNEASGCRSVRQCDEGNVCSLQRSSYHGLFSSGCIPEKACRTIHTSKLLYQTNVRTVSDQAPYCCRGDFCNEFVQHDIVTSLVG